MTTKSTGKSVLDDKTPTQAVNTFTDKQLFGLYGKLKASYCIDKSFDDNFSTMEPELLANFLPGGIYADMSDSDKDKIYTVFTTFLNARSSNPATSFRSFSNAFEAYRQNINRTMPPVYVIEHHYYQRSSWFEDYLFWHCFFSDNSSHHHHNTEDFWKVLLMLLVAAVAAVVLYFAACYLFTAIAESVERFWYNEGWLQASISLLGVVGGALAGALFMMTMIQPFGAVAVMSIAFASIVAAALTGGLTNTIQGVCIEALNADAMDSADPYRFALTDAESVALEQKGIDPTKVKCAIAALRYEIEELPSLSSRWFGDSHQQEKLQLIRALRRGEKEVLLLGDLRFDLHTDVQPVVVLASNDDRPTSVDGIPVIDLDLVLKGPALGYTG